MTQKVLQIGTSAGVTIPKSALQELRLNIGDKIEIVVDKKHRALSIKPIITVDEELIAWTDTFIEAYRPALEALAKK